MGRVQLWLEARFNSCRGFPDRHTIILRLLQLLWIGIILRYELGVFDDVLRDCKWPVPETDTQARMVHIALVADPQIMNKYSYRHRSLWLYYLGQFVVDLNLRKNWRIVLKRLQPRSDAVVFLGDMMDGGRDDSTDTDYEAYYARFQDIFKPHSPPSPTYYLPGNRDFGLGLAEDFSTHGQERYISHFAHQQWNNNGLNYHISVAGHTLVFIDALGLIEEFEDRMKVRYDSGPPKPRAGGTVEFIENLASSKHMDPVILMTHIPLERPSDASCGPLREKGTIKKGTGYGSQNTLTWDTSRFLLNKLKPVLIFSGDDHDYCDLTHRIPVTQQTTPEVTVKSFAMNMGIRRPGFQLLSLVAPSPSTNQPAQHLHTPCFLPDQMGIYSSAYVPLLVISLFGILAANLYRIRFGNSQEERGKGCSRPSKTRGSLATPDLGGTDEHLVVFNRGSRDDEMQAEGESEEFGRVVDTNGHGNGKAHPHSKKNSVQFLPAPAAYAKHRQRQYMFSWTFLLAGTRRRISVPHFAESSVVWLSSIRGGGAREWALIWSCVRDVGMVAWPALGVFAGISWWMFHS